MWIDPEERIVAATQKIEALEATVAELKAKIEEHIPKTIHSFVNVDNRLGNLEVSMPTLVQEVVQRMNEHIQGPIDAFYKTAHDASNEALDTLRTAADRVAADLASKTATFVDANIVQQVIEKTRLVAPARVQAPAAVSIPGPKTQPRAYGAKD